MNAEADLIDLDHIQGLSPARVCRQSPLPGFPLAL